MVSWMCDSKMIGSFNKGFDVSCALGKCHCHRKVFFVGNADKEVTAPFCPGAVFHMTFEPNQRRTARSPPDFDLLLKIPILS